MKIKITIFILIYFLFNISIDLKPSIDGKISDQWQQQLTKYATIYSLIKGNYPHSFNKEKLFFNSIRRLLGALDPHSYFLDPLSMRSLKEDQKGNYYGIGIRITKFEDRLTVIAPLEGTPAYKLGILAGDVIVEINGEKSQNISLDEAMRKLRGSKGTIVNIKIRREGIKGLIPFSIKRAEIPLNSISYSFSLPWAPEIGYINIRTFGNTTYNELIQNIEKLNQSKNIKALILDLRGNAGGSLFAAIDVADSFLKKDLTIVSIKGRTIKKEYLATKDNQFEKLPLVVLINRGSASASEIVAAALKDNNRAIIIGSRSWGKGLVQTISRTLLNTSVALTTAKYYTPNNKCLQRNFDAIDDYLFFLNDNYSDYDSNKKIEGGVFPDILIEQEYYPRLIINFISKGLFFKFSRQFIGNNENITKNYIPNSSVIKEFKSFLKSEGIQFNEKVFNQYENRIKMEIQREVISRKYNAAEGFRAYLNSDLAIQKAVEVLKNKYK